MSFFRDTQLDQHFCVIVMLQLVVEQNTKQAALRHKVNMVTTKATMDTGILGMLIFCLSHFTHGPLVPLAH